MKSYAQMSREELRKEYEELSVRFEGIKKGKLKLDMSRGKPSYDQLELSNEMMDVLDSASYFNDETGTDCRNYGILAGIPEAKRLMGAMSEVGPDDMIIYGNSSDATKAIDVILTAVCDAIKEGLEERKVEKADEEAAEAQANTEASAAHKERRQRIRKAAPKAEAEKVAEAKEEAAE